MHGLAGAQRQRNASLEILAQIGIYLAFTVMTT
jgi:hypothetical protein